MLYLISKNVEIACDEKPFGKVLEANNKSVTDNMKLMILSLVLSSTLLDLSVRAQSNTVPPSLTVNGIQYSLGTNTIVATMIHGQGDKGFEVSLHGSGVYGFSVHGYGVGFPTYGIIADTASGGVNDNTVLRLHFSDTYLVPDGGKPKVYSGYLPIHVFQGSETGFDTNYFHLPVTVTVYPDLLTNVLEKLKPIK